VKRAIIEKRELYGRGVATLARYRKWEKVNEGSRASARDVGKVNRILTFGNRLSK